VACACNVAVYLAALPASKGKPSSAAGAHGLGIPPFYCDASGAGGQACPEIDLMEANSLAFQATPHNCEARPDRTYGKCDSGCAQNTRDDPSTYGPGTNFTIDTTKPFEVHTEFFEESGILSRMRTTLRQVWRQVHLDHSNCDAAYLAQLSDALTDGMVLRISYRGDKVGSTPCSAQACAGNSAGRASISDITVGSRILNVPALSSKETAQPPQQVKTASHSEPGFEWVVSDPKDILFGHLVPDAIINDSNRFVRQGQRGFVAWKSATHLVERRARAEAAVGDKPVWEVSDAGDALYGQAVPENIVNDPQRFVKMGGRGLARWKQSSHLVELREPKQSDNLADVVVRYDSSSVASATAHLSSRWGERFSTVGALCSVGMAVVAVVAVRHVRRVIPQLQRRTHSDEPLVRSGEQSSDEFAL